MTQGINEAKVTQWLAGHVDGLSAPLRFDLISGGRSNLTYAVTDADGRKVVLRRPPTSHVLSTAHDMAGSTGSSRRCATPMCRSPRRWRSAPDEAVNDRPFYVMGFVDGHVLRDVAAPRRCWTSRGRTVAGEQLVDVLAAIHRVDVDAVGLGDFARRDGYIERQLRRWHGQFGKSQEQAREIGVYRPVPLVDEVHALLTERLPAQQGTAIVHGDYRLDNTIMSGDGRIMAVLDWELCTLGDPLADVGTLLAYWAEDAGTASASPAVSRWRSRPPPGCPASRPGPRSPPGTPRAPAGTCHDIGYYLAFAYWKLACILEGVFVRYAANAMGTGASKPTPCSASRTGPPGAGSAAGLRPCHAGLGAGGLPSAYRGVRRRGDHAGRARRAGRRREDRRGRDHRSQRDLGRDGRRRGLVRRRSG